MNPLLEKTNINIPVEDELNEFRQEIEQKYAEAEMKNFVMLRPLKFKSTQRESPTEHHQSIAPEKAPATVRSRITHKT